MFWKRWIVSSKRKEKRPPVYGVELVPTCTFSQIWMSSRLTVSQKWNMPSSTFGASGEAPTELLCVKSVEDSMVRFGPCGVSTTRKKWSGYSEKKTFGKMQMCHAVCRLAPLRPGKGGNLPGSIGVGPAVESPLRGYVAKPMYMPLPWRRSCSSTPDTLHSAGCTAGR